MKQIIIFNNKVFDFDEKSIEFIQKFLGEEYLILSADIEEYIYIKELTKE